MAEVISNYEKFLEKVKGKMPDDSNPRVKALKHYFSKKGVISVDSKGDESWPSLEYPSKDLLKSKIASLNKTKKAYSEQQAQWKQRHLEARTYHLSNNVKKLSSGLYWKHLAKYVSDKNYREAADKVKLPAHLVTDKRWEPMVRMFVTDDDYRAQLTETVEKSIVYKGDRKVARFADDLKNFRMTEAAKKIGELQKKIGEINADLFALHELMKWVKG